MAVTSTKKKSKINYSEQINNTINNTDIKNANSENKNLTKNKGGRPSNGEVKKITLAIPVELYEGVETGASLFFNGNKTAYINALIKKDLEDNLEKYNEFQAMKQK